MIEILKWWKSVKFIEIKGPRKAWRAPGGWEFDKKLPGWLGFAKFLKFALGKDGGWHLGFEWAIPFFIYTGVWKAILFLYFWSWNSRCGNAKNGP